MGKPKHAADTMGRIKQSTVKLSGSGRFTIGPKGMAKLNAIEGIKQSGESRKMFAEFERTGASPETRRRVIMEKHIKQG